MTEKLSRVLIVEDDPDLSDMLTVYFRMQNYEVLTAAWGRDALAISAEEALDLVILDIRLPDIDGYEVCQQLRTQRRTQDVPIIFMTEKSDRVDRLHGLEMGVVDYVTKPFDNQELLLRVRNAIQRSEQAATLNPVTELPQVDVLDERLTTLLDIDRDWVIMLFAIGGLNTLRERYGFLAADEMLRAITLMVRNAVREYGGEDDFVGHLGEEEFVVVTTPGKANSIRSRLETRVRNSLDHFYRADDYNRGFLSLSTGAMVVQLGEYDDAASVRRALRETIAPAASGG
jgi:PleD family two-component response regulator